MTRQEQELFRWSRIIVLLWDAAQPTAVFVERLAYAMQLGKPIRLLRLDDTRVPEDLGGGYADLETARVHGEGDGLRQIEVWLEALDGGQGGVGV